MCLIEVSKIKPAKTGIGFKTMIHDGGFSGVYYTTENLLPMQWHKADQEQIVSGTGYEYVSGFHIFLTSRNTRKYSSHNTLVKVRYRKATAQGRQLNMVMGGQEGTIDCVIAQEMMIIGYKNEATGRWIYFKPKKFTKAKKTKTRRKS